MPNTVIVTCAPPEAGEDAAPVAEVLHQLGDVIRLAPGLWYLSTRHWAHEVAERVWGVIDNSDARLVVVDASGNDAAWFGLDAKTSDTLDRAWLSGSLSGR